MSLAKICQDPKHHSPHNDEESKDETEDSQFRDRGTPQEHPIATV